MIEPFRGSYHFVFDVESVGLHGPAFALGFVVFDNAFNFQEERLLVSDPDFFFAEEDDKAWVKANVLPHLPPSPRLSKTQLVAEFWADWMRWQGQGALAWADVPVPVEAAFLRETGRLYPSRRGQLPYPLLDVATLLYATGQDPIGTHERLEWELPAHNPLNDARQSARLLVEALKKLRGDSSPKLLVS
jgi:hypothetical protein